MPIVIRRAEPHVVHHQWKPNHDTGHANGTAKLEVSTVIDLRVFSDLPTINTLFLLQFSHLAVHGHSVRMAVGLDIPIHLLFLRASAGLARASRGERIRVNARGHLRVRIFVYGRDAGFPRSLESAGSLDVAWVAGFAAETSSVLLLR